MIDSSEDTKSRIELGAKWIFSKHGFARSSMRQIADASKTSLGVIYYYYKDKDSLFCSLVAPAIRGLEKFTADSIDSENISLDLLSTEERKLVGYSKEPFYQFVISNADQMHLLFFCAGGSSLEHYEEDLVRLFNESTYKYLWRHKDEEEFKHKELPLTPWFIDFFSRYIITAIKSIIQHRDRGKDELRDFCRCHEIFTFGGWRDVMKV